jgi:hypothetical protein
MDLTGGAECFVLQYDNTELHKTDFRKWRHVQKVIELYSETQRVQKARQEILFKSVLCQDTTINWVGYCTGEHRLAEILYCTVYRVLYITVLHCNTKYSAVPIKSNKSTVYTLI